VAKANSFVLLGHDCPYGRYPAPVIPVGDMAGDLVAIYPSGPLARPTADKLDRNARYVRALPSAGRFSPFDYQQYRLFAFSENDVDIYGVADEADYFAAVLQDPRAEGADNSIRLMLARQTGRKQLIRAEIGRASQHMAQSTNPGKASAWRARELSKLDSAFLLIAPREAQQSPLREIVIRVIRRSTELLLPAAADMADNRGSEIAEAAGLVVLQTQTAGAPDPHTIYALGMADALGKPALILATGEQLIPCKPENAVIVAWKDEDLQSEASIQRFESDLSRGLAQVRAAQDSGPARVRQSARDLLRFANSISKQAPLIRRPLRALSKMVTLQAPAPELELPDRWQEYERLHSQWISHYLNGPASAAERAMAALERAWGPTAADLSADFDYLRVCADSYEKAFSAAQARFSTGYSGPLDVAEVVERLDQSFSKLAVGADKVVAELAAALVALPPTPRLSGVAHANG